MFVGFFQSAIPLHYILSCLLSMSMKINNKKLNFFCNFPVFYHFNFSVKVSYTHSFNTFTTTTNCIHLGRHYWSWVNIQAQNALKKVTKILALPIITENSTDDCGMVISSLGSAQLSFSLANNMTFFFFTEACSLSFSRSSHPRLLALYCIIKDEGIIHVCTLHNFK